MTEDEELQAIADACAQEVENREREEEEREQREEEEREQREYEAAADAAWEAGRNLVPAIRKIIDYVAAQHPDCEDVVWDAVFDEL